MSETKTRTALLISVKCIPEEVFVSESTATALEDAAQWLTEDNRASLIPQAQETLLVHGFYEYKDDDNFIISLSLVPAHVR